MEKLYIRLLLFLANTFNELGINTQTVRIVRGYYPIWQYPFNHFVRNLRHFYWDISDFCFNCLYDVVGDE